MEADHISVTLFLFQRTGRALVGVAGSTMMFAGRKTDQDNSRQEKCADNYRFAFNNLSKNLLNHRGVLKRIQVIGQEKAIFHIPRTNYFQICAYFIDYHHLNFCGNLFPGLWRLVSGKKNPFFYGKGNANSLLIGPGFGK
ncbi:MAG TPA: hypothetical protein VFU15_01160 [Bacteroidia bacterium]|nr:hypothetical protein [Bacteroidia bacterium]